MNKLLPRKTNEIHIAHNHGFVLRCPYAGQGQVGPPQPAAVWYNTQEQTNNPDVIRSYSLRTCAMLPYAHIHNPANEKSECALPGYYHRVRGIIAWST